MSELPDLPPPPRRTRPVPEGGLDAVVAAGRARRSRTAAGATTTTLALVLAGVLLQPTGALESLTSAIRALPAASSSPEVPQADPTATATPTAPATAAPTEPAATDPSAASAPPTGPAQTATPSPEPAATSSPAPVPTATSTPPAPTSAPSPTPTAAPPTSTGTVRVAYREDTDEDATGTCEPGPVEGSGQAAATCSYETSSGRTARRGEQVTASYGQCRDDAGATATVFAFAGGQEKDVVVVDAGGQEVFRFSDTVRYTEGAHERRLRPGACIEWTGRWDLVTTDGRPVPPGSYRITTTVAAERVQPEGAQEPVVRDFTASSTVTVRVVA